MDFMCLEFINSQWYISHEPFADPLKYLSWVKDFLKKWDLAVPVELSDHELMQLRTLRTILSHAIATLNNGEELSAEQLIEINRYLKLTPVHYELIQEEKRYKAVSRPEKANWNYVLSRLAVSFIQLISENDLSYIKKCENPECGWVFFDETKNHTRRWCGNSCSSLIKVRRFREKHKELKPSIN